MEKMKHKKKQRIEKDITEKYGKLLKVLIYM